MWPVPADALFLTPANAGGASTVVRLEPAPQEVATLSRANDARDMLWRAKLDDLRKPDLVPAWWNEAAFTGMAVRSHGQTAKESGLRRPRPASPRHGPRVG